MWIATLVNGEGTPMHVTEHDAMFVKRALAKRWPKFMFAIATDRTRVTVNVLKPIGARPEDLPSLEVVRTMKDFAEGFIASAHLWER